jgi:hypothetical protein
MGGERVEHAKDFLEAPDARLKGYGLICGPNILQQK